MDGAASFLLKGSYCLMKLSSYAIGQAVFIRTDTPDFVEETVPFKTLEEMVRICSTSHDHMTLDKVMVYSMINNEPQAIMLGFLSASKARPPQEKSVSDL